MATAAEPHRLCNTAVLYKSVAQPVALQQQISPITASAADVPISVSSRCPHNRASSTDVLSDSAPLTMKDTVLIVLSLLYFVVER